MENSMWSKSRNLILLLVCVLGLSARAFAAATATITVGGSEQQVSGVWDTTSITISFNGYTETVSPGQFSTTASVASAFAAQFSRDYAHAGLSAQVVCGSSSSLITFALGGTAIFGPVSVIGSTTSFQMSPAGFLSATSQVYDTGTITLTVGGVTAATTSYVANATPSTIASGLAAGVTVGSFVNVTAVNDGLYLVAKQAGAGTNYSYSIQDTSSNPAVFTQPSFGSAPGNLDGGANAGVAGQAQPIYSFNGAYDGVGNLISYTDSAMGNWGFSYDSLNRLKTGNPSSGTYNGQHICWAYDGFGNRTAESLQTTACPTSETSVTATAVYNNSNQIKSAAGIGSASGYTFSSTFSYDDSGDVTNDTTNKYLYDAEGRICAVQDIKFGGAITGYIYGPDGTRVSKGTITSWSCDPSANGFTPSSDYILGTSNEQLTELDINASQGAMTWQHTNVWAGGTLMATYDNDGLHFYFDDPLGTRRAQTDYAGVLQQTCQSLPFGNAETCAATPTEHLFTGKERDGESGNDYFGARYYASSIGRFMSPDWSAKAEPVPYAKLGDPQTLNLYGYMQNNPLGGVDQDGHCPNAFALGCNAFDNLEGDEENSANQSTPPPSAQQQPAQQQASSGGGGFWHHVGNLLHLHSWNYVQTTVTTTEVDTVREPNDAVTATADAASLATAFSEKLPWGVGAAISGVSIANDHSTLNTTTNLLGLIPGYAGPMAVTGAFNDFFDYGAHNSKAFEL
jgi:RHS repeat-associated protein